jgi:hypothetical protein
VSVPRRLSPTALAACLAGLALAAGVAAVVLAVGTSGSSQLSAAGEAAWSLVFSIVGLVLATRQRNNAIAWLFLGIGLFGELNTVGSAYNVFDFRLHHGSLPLGGVSLLVQPSWAPAIMLMAICLMVFPEGRLNGPVMRWSLRLVLVTGTVWAVGAYGIVLTAIAEHHIVVTTGGDLAQVDQPGGAWAWWSYAQDTFFWSLYLGGLAWLVDAVVRYRGAVGEARAQQKWLFAGVSVFGVAGFLSTVGGSPSSGWTAVVYGVATTGLAALPLSVGIAVVKFHLYDIDRVISRTIAYALVTALVVGGYVGLVALGTSVASFSSQVTVAASTLVLAAAFNPVRRRVQRLVDRRFNRARYDAEAQVAAFAARLRDPVDVGTIEGQLLEVLERTVEPASAWLWLGPRGSS